VPLTPQGILGHTITEDEFRLLGYLDARHYLTSSTARFADWDSSFSTAHPDWHKRIEVQSALADVLYDVIKGEPAGRPRKIIFLGASKGTIATYFHMAALRRAGLLDDFAVTILDYLWEPLLITQRGEFEVTARAEADMGLADELSITEYRRRLASCEIVRGNVCDTGLPDNAYDVVVAPYIQHHLGFLDKEFACAEMVRMTVPGGLCLLGDLTFDYPAFSEWLAAHAVETVPYALESFVPMDDHLAMFGDLEVLERRSGSFYYSCALRKPAG